MWSCAAATHEYRGQQFTMYTYLKNECHGLQAKELFFPLRMVENLRVLLELEDMVVILPTPPLGNPAGDSGRNHKQA